MKSIMKAGSWNWKLIGIVAGAAAALVYPTIQLVKYIQGRLEEGKKMAGGSEETPVKAFSPAYRGKHKPHHRHAHNGHGQE